MSFVLFCETLKSGDGSTDGRTDNTCENNDHYRPWLWVGLVDQNTFVAGELFVLSYIPFFSLRHKKRKLTLKCSSSLPEVLDFFYPKAREKAKEKKERTRLKGFSVLWRFVRVKHILTQSGLMWSKMAQSGLFSLVQSAYVNSQRS